MPSAYTNGQERLDGTADTQVEAIWLYLQDGPRAQLPAGLQKEFIPLVPTDGAIIYRNFIEGAGPRHRRRLSGEG